MSGESQFVLALLGFLVAIAVPVVLWIVNSHIKMRNELVRQEERINQLSAVVRAMGSIVTGDGNRVLIDSALDEPEQGSNRGEM